MLQKKSLGSKNVKRQRRILGGILKIDLGDGTFSFARVCREPLIAFYDIRSSVVLPHEYILKRKILFRIGIYNYSITHGIWELIGKAPLEESLKEKPQFYRYDPLVGKYYFYVDGTNNDIPTTWEECNSFECASVWEPGAVEQRLRDYFDGRPCWYLECEKPGWKFIPIKEFYRRYGYNFRDSPSI